MHRVHTQVLSTVIVCEQLFHCVLNTHQWVIFVNRLAWSVKATKGMLVLDGLLHSSNYTLNHSVDSE